MTGDLKATAIHESGHAVVAWASDVAVGEIDIRSSGDRRGVAELSVAAEEIERFLMDDYEDIEDSERMASVLGAISWAGLVAQERAGYPDDGGFGRPTATNERPADGSDWAALWDLVCHLDPPDGQYDRLLDAWHTHAVAEVDRHWRLVESLASVLLERLHVTEAEITAILEGPESAGA